MPSSRCLLLSLLLVLPARAADALEPDDALVKLLGPIREKHKIPALFGAVVRGDKVVSCGAVGVRKLGVDVPVTIDDKIYLGSCTKAMTATMIATLIEAKRLSWDTTLAKAFPEQRATLHADLRDITLAQLLTHTSGLRANVEYDAKAPGNQPGPVQRQYLFKKVLREPPESTPGTKGLYSNLGYVVAALMAESVTKRNWDDLMRERLFRPLKMTTAGFGPPGTKGRVDQPWGHFLKDGKVEPTQVDNPLLLSPASGVHMGLADWGRFVSLHLRGPAGKEKLLSAETFAKLHEPAKGHDYAGGWFLVQQPWTKGRGLNHMGSNGSWHVVAWLAPTRELAFLAAANLHGEPGLKATDETIAAMAGVWLKKLGD